MHLLAATPGTIGDGSEAVDLGQTPGEIVVLSAADSELACLAAAQALLPADRPSLRLANLMRLGHHASVDLYVEQVVRQARIVVVRLLGGRSYWPYGVEQIAAACRTRGVPVAFLPGDDKPDPDLAADTTVAPEMAERLWRYLLNGGVGNAGQFLRLAAALIGRDADWREPAPLPSAGLYPEGCDLDATRAGWDPAKPLAFVVFYRALVQAGNTAAVEALVEELRSNRLNVLPIYVASLKDELSAATVRALVATAPPDVIVNATGFAVAAPGRPEAGPFGPADCAVLQAVFSGGSEAAWRDGTAGLSARDIAMNVALPEVDGRILARAVSFKAGRRDDETQCDLVSYVPVPDRVRFVARLAARWAALRRKPASERRVALVLANYPNRDGRLGNGVGLDTPAGTVEVLNALTAAGYRVEEAPPHGQALMDLLQQGVTNDLKRRDREVREAIALPDYLAYFHSLPEAVRRRVAERWGPPERDPRYRPGALSCGGFDLAVIRFGNVAVGVQPSRGYDVDPASSYHDPDLVPPHGYLAFYAWLQDGLRADAVVHMGKHGNLEWLPGKALALSEDCFPEAALGPLPHLYPFIVNDPGEGTQAKRRAQAVIVDHLTPPLTRAESYGPLRQLEQLVDEYYEAAQVDRRRLPVLEREIDSLVRVAGLDVDCGISAGDSSSEALKKLDNHLCELKELQIRDGLHVFGVSPAGRQLTDLLVALVRTPRGGRPEDESLLRALAADLELGFDPLDCELADAWTGPRPDALSPSPSPALPLPRGAREGEGVSSPLSPCGRGVGGEGAWRTNGDTVERLEALASALVDGAEPPGPASAAVLAWLTATLRPAVESCGAAEIDGLLRGLAGRFVPPGPSGAPTRGRPDVLPTGRNFYSVDTRTVPTPAAWHLGWKSATLLLERHLQEHGEWPRAMALSAWGTANMRTGGDDVAQALALMGVRPVWETASRRVTGFEILPASVLDRPRVDVTLRVSGFFRDAFPDLVALVDSAARAVAALDEPADANPLAARVRADAAALEAQGLAPQAARARAARRVFGAKPGAYGAGLQALIDERGWRTDADLAAAFVAWGGWSYGAGDDGTAAHGDFEERLRRTDAVVHNQDNREHDLLDSDDYYQFEGGMTAAVRVLSGAQPAVWHNDHSRPETPRIRSLDEEIARVVRGRAANPKWIAGVMRHGYKGAFEMAATVDYLFAFAATSRCVRHHHFDALFDAYLADAAVRGFIEAANPAALREMAERFQEAIDRGLWRPRRNDAGEMLDGLVRSGA